MNSVGTNKRDTLFLDKYELESWQVWIEGLTSMNVWIDRYEWLNVIGCIWVILSCFASKIVIVIYLGIYVKCKYHEMYF